MFDSKISHINVSAHPTQLFTPFSVFSLILDAVLAPRNITAGMLAIISGIKQLSFKSRLWWRGLARKNSSDNHMVQACVSQNMTIFTLDQNSSWALFTKISRENI